MKYVLILMLLFGMQKTLFAQYVYTINADSVKITNHCDTAELIIENHTQNVPGFLYNKGRGRTEFRSALQKINDNTYVVGADTLKLNSGITGSLGHNEVAFGSSNNTITGASSFLYDSLNQILTLGNADLTTGNNNLIFSYNLPEAAVGQGNVGIGMDEMFSQLTSGQQNVGIGDYTMTAVTTGTGNTGVSPGALQRLTTGNRNVALGYEALQWLTTQSFNTAIGPGIFNNATVGNANVGIGGNPEVYFNIPYTVGDSNVLVGYLVNRFNSTGSNNIVLGNGCNAYSTNNTTLIGTDMNTSLSNIVGIGRDDQNIILGTTAVASDNGAKVQINGTAGALNINSNWDENTSASLISANLNSPLNDGALGPLFSYSVNYNGLLSLGPDGTLSFTDPWNGGEFNNRYLTIAPADRISGSYGSANSSTMKLHTFFDPTSGYGVGSDITIASEVEPSGGSFSYTTLDMNPTIYQTGGTGIMRGIYYHPNDYGVTTKLIAFENTNGDVYLNSGQDYPNWGRTGVHGNTNPTAWLHIGAGSALPGEAPLKLTASPGFLLVTPEDGAVEYDGTDLYFTQNATRYKLSKTLTGQLTTNFGAPSLSAFNSVTTTLSVAGAQPGDVVGVSANSGAVNPPSIIITAYITSANTVTLQAYNASNSSVTLASDTYRVSVIH